MLDDGDPNFDHNAEVERVEVHTVYTDGSGSGSQGRCSRNTPAGWGFCWQDDTGWREAYGPVVVDAEHADYKGSMGY